MHRRGYLLAVLAITALQVLVLIGVYGSRLADLDAPLTYAWTRPPSTSELWRPDPTLSQSGPARTQTDTYTQVDTHLATAGAARLARGTWNAVDERLGAPVGSDHADFPTPLERGNIVVGQAIGAVVDSPARLANLFLLLSYFLVLWVAAAYCWLWRPGSRWLVPLAALAVANAPYHFIRENFFAANYVLVVPTIVSCLLLVRRDPLGRSARIGVIGWIVIAPFFGLYNAITAVVLAAWTTAGLLLLGRDRGHGRGRRAVVAAGWLTLWVSCWLVVDLLPTMARWAEIGAVDSLQRTSAVSDKYALRISDLFTQPDTVFGVPGLRRSEWLATAQYEGEGVVVGGLIGVTALVLAGWLLAVRLLGRRAPGDQRSARWTGWMAAGDPRASLWLLLGTIAICGYGGIGSLLNATGLSVIKSWERIAFVAYPIMLLLVLSVASAWLRRSTGPLVDRPIKNAAYALVGVVVLGALAGIPWSADGHGATGARARWTELVDFYHDVEAASASGSVLFLPALAYPEGPGRCDLPPYDGLVGYAVTSATRWGSGANRGRELGERQFAVTNALSTDPVAAAGLARRLGYDAIVVDARGLPVADRTTTLESLRDVATNSFMSSSGMLTFLDLRGVVADVPVRTPTRLKDYELTRLLPPCRVVPSAYPPE